jgi:hypothetical protein
MTAGTQRSAKARATLATALRRVELDAKRSKCEPRESRCLTFELHCQMRSHYFCPVESRDGRTASNDEGNTFAIALHTALS